MARFPYKEAKVGRLLETKEGWRRGLTGHRLHPIDETLARVSVYKAFNIMPDEQVHLENTYRAFDPQQLIISRIKQPLYAAPDTRLQYLLD
jgi:hypothetical protein